MGTPVRIRSKLCHSREDRMTNTSVVKEVVSIAVAPGTQLCGPRAVAMCDDGTIWIAVYHEGNIGSWYRGGPPVPCTKKRFVDP